MGTEVDRRPDEKKKKKKKGKKPIERKEYVNNTDKNHFDTSTSVTCYLTINKKQGLHPKPLSLPLYPPQKKKKSGVGGRGSKLKGKGQRDEA